MEGNNSNGDIQVAISIDNSGSLITDSGEERKIVCEWDEPVNFTLPRDTKSVIIKAHNDRGNVGGIVASFKSAAFNIVTDESWECADLNSYKTPNICSCVECTWQKAKTYGYVNASNNPWKAKVKGINGSAQWIWVSNSHATRVWCKKTFGE